MTQPAGSDNQILLARIERKLADIRAMNIMLTRPRATSLDRAATAALSMVVADREARR